jgi:ribose transport system permease protein
MSVAAILRNERRDGVIVDETPDDLRPPLRDELDDTVGHPSDSETSPLPASGIAPASAVGNRGGIDRVQVLGAALWFLRAGPALILILLILVLSQLTPTFLSARNLGNVLGQSAVICVMAIGQLLVIVTRGIDLSVGSTLALATVVGALVYREIDSAAVVVPAMLLTGMAVGAVNGIVYVWGRLPHPFIITLATLSVVRGVALWLSDGSPIQGMPAEVQALGAPTFLGFVPLSTFVVVAIAAAVLVLTTRMVWGRWVYAVGGNPDAARRTGIPVNGVLISVYILSGLAAGFGALLTSARTNAGAPTFGNLAELDAIAAVIIGGASFLGGRGNVGNAIVGALMIGVIRNGMNLLNVDSFFQLIVIGVVIVLAVEADVVRSHLESRFRVLQAARS